jgi:D-erythronate 2-dehydrogenase
MKILITGGAGFLGARLARTLLARGSLAGETITALVLADLFPPPADLLADARVQARTGALLDQCMALGAEGFAGVFHLASAVSAECEADFELGLRSNLDTTRALLDALRAAPQPARLVFASSVAVFGSDPALPLPTVVRDDTLPTPQSSYGIHKFICEQLVADYSRKGFVDGRTARLMTVSVRPGRPNGAASGFLEAVCPVSAGSAIALASPATTIDGLIKVFEASREDFGGRTALNLPALTVTVQEMLDALAAVAGPEAVARVSFKPDAGVARMVGGWPARFESQRQVRLGLTPDRDFLSIVRQYARDNPAAVSVPLRL